MQLVQRERVWLWKELQKVPAFCAFPTDANFFLLRCVRDDVLDGVIGTLAEAKILIRDCRGVEGLDGPYLRFAIRTRPENTRLLDYMRAL
jgi:threonine-phosphate decarboxylase